ncbi:MAG TPA: DUF998 domain-containing protein [Halobacteriales archaeon]|uniref:DUF998 domain-containing protein n=1 Tax=Candidatus Hikarchaeum yamanae TaxID=2675326 RepID=UPI0017C5FE4D|nr:DUF998 domain-containing protein [Halobacteriales archaeon]|tara:strand:- start:6226 stop:6885 length:660 start_codon:yes stop_codon:yes gene_type:complete
MSIEKENLRRLGIYAGLLGPAIGLLSVIVAIYFAPWFNWTEFALSDLGVGELPGRIARSAPSNGLHIFIFNTGMMVAGIGLALFVFLTRSLHIRTCHYDSIMSKIGYSLIFIGGLNLALVGLFPIPSPLHFPVAAIYFIATPIGLVFVGGSYLSESRNFGILLILIGIVAFLSIVEIVAPYLLDLYSEGIAIPEMVEATLLSLGAWLISYRFWSQESKK